MGFSDHLLRRDPSPPSCFAAAEAVAVGSSDDEADGGGGDVGKDYVDPLLESNCLCDVKRNKREIKKKIVGLLNYK